MILFWCLIGVTYLILGVLVTVVWARLIGAGPPKESYTKCMAGVLVLLWPFLLLMDVLVVPFYVLGMVVGWVCKENPK